MVNRKQLPRSCDRCHSLKERCDRTPASASCCLRCHRLELACVTERPIKKAGRRPQPSKSPSSSSSLARRSAADNDAIARTLTLPLPLPPLAEDSSGDLAWLVGVLSSVQDSFFGQFVAGPTWVPAHRQSLLSCLLASHELLRDAFMACALLWPSTSPSPSSRNDNDEDEDGNGWLSQAPTAVNVSRSYRSASAAVDKLRRIHVASAADASSCLALGMLLLTFTERLGNDESYSICVHVLGSVKPKVVDAVAAADETTHSSSFLSCIVLTEIGQCFLRATVPTLRLCPAAVEMLAVDRYCGVCASLMPLLYDLCSVNHNMAAMRSGSEPFATTAEEEARLEAVEQSIRSWRPDLPKDKRSRAAFPAPFPFAFTAQEASCMMGQAHAMQTAALLIAHRLRYPFGSVDSAALALCTAIVTQVESMHRISGQAVPNIELPLFVACLELQDEAERSRHLRHSAAVAGSHLYRKRLEQMLKIFWQHRLQRSDMYWCDLGALLFPPAYA